MGSDVGAGSQGREEAMEVVSRDHILEEFNGSGHFGAIFFEFDIVQEKIKHIPCTGIVAVRTDLVIWDIVLVSIGR